MMDPNLKVTIIKGSRTIDYEAEAIYIDCDTLYIRRGSKFTPIQRFKEIIIGCKENIVKININ